MKLINAARFFMLLTMLSALAPAGATARSHGSHRSYSRSSYGYHRLYHREHRSAEAKREFERMTGFPHGRPGYVIDHIIPLACGGSDSPSNMQWQTITAGKAKDKWERKSCSPRT